MMVLVHIATADTPNRDDDKYLIGITAVEYDKKN